MTDYPFFGTCDSCAQGDRPLRSASDEVRQIVSLAVMAFFKAVADA